MISITRNANGSYTASAIVSDGLHAWLEWNQYYGYPKREVIKMFRDYLKQQNLKLSK